MPTYYIIATEKVVTTYTVEAGTPLEALKLFDQGTGEAVDSSDFIETLRVRVCEDIDSNPVIDREN